jgi:biotin carboxyl carrier protein
MDAKINIFRGENFVDVHYQGRHYRLDDQQLGLKKRSGSASANAGNNTAPLPGKIISINKQPSDPCVAGDVVVVMEAMKMEYKIKAHLNGILEKILVAPGDIVALGTELFVIKS